ncbi:hypothetical protein SAMN05216337_101791 [Bradyrhizobium brasilense]|uniref:HNH endonuclease n=1 Tax=Bradyrhizobium brasilense TaxID=1419277 RepID=A0A1G6YTI4_9BRAD|nr:hypothetical protein [Bradyrhizobium brasilense]SDD93719.1 hypothetical protein SAMN05216337_101791 [Bradyrhizobium brasilense]
MALQYPRRKLSSSQREALYDRCRGDNEFPICNIPNCGLPVKPGERWVESHFPVPHALGGTETGVAHEACNKFYAEHVEVPRIAKAKRVRRKHIGAHVSRTPLPGGRNDSRKRLIGGGVEPRGARRITKLSREDFARLLSITNLETPL